MKLGRKYKDHDLKYQPFQDALARFDTTARSKNINSPFSEKGFDAVLGNESLTDAYISGLSGLFKGDDNLVKAFESCTRHVFADHGNPFSGYYDTVTGDPVVYGSEGYGATAITGNYNQWTRLAPVLTAGYLARSRALELYMVINDDKPTFFRRYSVTYLQRGLDGERLIFPRAIRSGKVAGMLDLPLCNPANKDENPDNKNVEKFSSESGLDLNMIKVGSTGNIMEQAVLPDGSPVDKYKHSLERQCSIDYVRVSFKKGGQGAGKDDLITKVIRTRIERIQSLDGKTSERRFDSIVTIPYQNADGQNLVRTVRVAAIMDLDTGYYQVLNDGTNEVTHVHFKVRITNVANEMSTYMTGQDNYNLSFDIENKIYGSIPMIPELMADYNAAGDGVSWISFMTDQMTEAYAGIRDNDLENFMDEEYDYDSTQFELAMKLGGFKFNGTYPIIPRHPGGSDDILGPQRMAFKHYLTRVFTRTEKYTNFDRGIDRQWIMMANDEDVDILPDVSWVSNPNTIGGGEGSDGSFRYGFSLDDGYGYIDNFRRKVRIIGSKDERWLNKPIHAVLKSLDLAAPTTLYFPYMFRVFSSISPDMRNRPAMLFASRDAKRISTMVQARIQIEGNNLSLYSNAAAFAAGQTSKFIPVYTDDGNTMEGQAGNIVGQNNIPDYIEM